MIVLCRNCFVPRNDVKEEMYALLVSRERETNETSETGFSLKYLINNTLQK